MKSILKTKVFIVLMLYSLAFSANAQAPYWLKNYESAYQQNPAEAAKQWYKEAKFGMFVHLNLASLCEKGKDDYTEFKRGKASDRLLVHLGIDRKKYDSSSNVDELLYSQYNLTNFDPESICQMAKKAHMSYIAFTTHHLGGCYNFKTSLSDFNSLNAPCSRDLVAEMAKACKKYNIALFLYVPPSISLTTQDHYQHNRTYLTELLTQYGNVAGIWFDGIGGYYKNPANYKQLDKLHALVKELQPHALISFKEGALGDEDFLSPEHFMLPFEYSWNDDGIQKRYDIRVNRWKQHNKGRWENCMKHKLREVNTVMQKCKGRDNYGGDGGWINDETATHLTGNEVYEWLTYARHTGSNLLMNIGPRSDGSIHPDDLKALTKVGEIIDTKGWPKVKHQIEKYEANWESLRRHEIPKWAEDAKFGIYAHWGVYSQTGAWNHTKANWGNYYITGYHGYYSPNQNNEQRQLFEEHVGKIQNGYGYKDLAKKFKAEAFDPIYWADLIEKSGAKYAGMCAVHHDGYCMWDSEVTDFCAGKLGPKRDVNGELLAVLKKRGIKTIASFHHGRTVKHFDGIVKKLKSTPGYEQVDLLNPDFYNYYWYLGGKERFTAKRKALTMEYIDKYSPDVLWFDGGGGKYDTEEIIAHFFNNGIKNNKEVCIHNKGNFGKNFGLYSYENGAHRPSYVDWPWEDDTPSSTGWCDWQWDKNIQYKKSRDVIVRLCDLVSRNGGLLLSMNPRPDGSLDKEQEELLLGIGKWLKQNGEAIYGTRPWKIYGEGHLEDLFFTQTNPIDGKKSRPIQPNTTLFNWEDVRFTTKDNVLYATTLGIAPDKHVIIKSLNQQEQISSENKITSIELIGYGKIKYRRDANGLYITLPDELPNKVALVFKINVKGKLISRKNTGSNSVIPAQT
ncbi:hypothetical protein EYV94_15920 [Puteibacter caeruleilacunae]|nr:hypothetical protein EYV94_15920 [Puteibacter caeruleilacunae]